MRFYKNYLGMKNALLDMEKRVKSGIYIYLTDKGLFDSLISVLIDRGYIEDEITLVFDKEISEKQIKEFAEAFDLRLSHINHKIKEMGTYKSEIHSYSFKSLNILKFDDKYYYKIKNETKQMTIRKNNNKDLKVGEKVFAEFKGNKQTLKLQIKSITVKKVKELGYREAKAEGLDNLNGYEKQANERIIDELNQYYSKLEAEDIIYCFEFKKID